MLAFARPVSASGSSVIDGLARKPSITEAKTAARKLFGPETCSDDTPPRRAVLNAAEEP